MPRRLVLLMLAVALPLASQELPFTHFTPGGQAVTLSSASVQKIIQDRQGYIWLAFYSTGISRYDGHSMESYGVADGLADLTVRELVEDARGHRSEEHTSELQSLAYLVCRLLLEKKKRKQ